MTYLRETLLPGPNPSILQGSINLSCSSITHTEPNRQRDRTLLPLSVSLLKLEPEGAVIAERRDTIAELAPSRARAVVTAHKRQYNCTSVKVFGCEVP